MVSISWNARSAGNLEEARTYANHLIGFIDDFEQKRGGGEVSEGSVIYVNYLELSSLSQRIKMDHIPR